jgi:tRNA dimethylallyltransferase
MVSDISVHATSDKQGTDHTGSRRVVSPRPVVVIGGPTASGKSALALAIAREFGGWVINADSMQVYRDLPILTAQPEAGDQSLAPHRLYGFLTLTDLCSAAGWANWALMEIAAAQAAGALPIVVGGTGLYLRSLMEGMSPIPDIAPTQRAQVQALLAEIGVVALHGRLSAVDPVMGAKLHPHDSQRVMRAWEVLQATGRSLAEWQLIPSMPPTGLTFQSWVVQPPREQLYAACDRRFTLMLERGALAEVAAALGHYGGKILALPGGKALGFADLAASQADRISLDQAIVASQQATRNYAKRQTTWFRNQLSNANFISPDMVNMKFSESSLRKIFQNIRDFGLTVL